MAKWIYLLAYTAHLELNSTREGARSHTLKTCKLFIVQLTINMYTIFMHRMKYLYSSLFFDDALLAKIRHLMGSDLIYI